VPGRIVAALRRDIPLLLLDVAVVLVSFLVALVLRFEGRVPAVYWRNVWLFVPLAAFAYVYLNWSFGLYGQMWRYASVREARRVLLAGVVATAFVLAATEVLGGYRRVLPLSVTILGGSLSLLGFGAVRFQSRLFAFRRREADHEPTRVLLVGAGDGGALILRDILRHPDLGLVPAGVVDDDPRKVGRALQGVRILGTRADLADLIRRLRVNQVLLAVPSATRELVREVAAVCERMEVDLRVLPSVREIVNGRVGVRDIRDVRIEDLLGRQMVQTDLAAVGDLLAGRRVLVTGAGGSIGAEIVRQVAAFGPSSLVALDRDETHLHDLAGGLPAAASLEVVLADVRERENLEAVMARHRPQVVFHAAAHKHLPILERHPREAVLTNILGTRNVAAAALAAGAERFVLISTDKAVRPSSVMGASKRLAEQVIWTLQGRGCAFSAVRFGNVIGSRGGVVQTFLRQVASGGPVTVTHPDMARYFMSIEEAVQLVLQAAALADGGEVLTLEMGEPVRIMELAHEVVRMSGRVPDRDVAITLIGARRGEKLVEDLLDPEEGPRPSPHPSITVSRPPVPQAETLQRVVGELRTLAERGDDEAVAERLLAYAGAPEQAATRAPGTG
jgi:FlaA1/EpsC-like NDP-sugar epimerase